MPRFILLRASARFFGLDIYNMNASIAAVVEYLDRSILSGGGREGRHGCLTPWERDPATYGRAALTDWLRRMWRPVLLALRDLLDKQLKYEGTASATASSMRRRTCGSCFVGGRY